jgi:NADPH:quinone reductase-like Zn-dependent oxidoreductase
MVTGTMRVVKAQGDGTAKIVEAPIPTLRPDYILVKTKAVALNPTDWKHVAFVQSKTTIGCDYAGIVEEVGPAVTKDFKKGDRIFGFTHGGNEVYPSDGAFGEYLEAKGDVQMHVPDGVSFEEAASMAVGILTCGQGMYQKLKLPSPDQPIKEVGEKPKILIYGGSTATGVYAIQYAKL